MTKICGFNCMSTNVHGVLVHVRIHGCLFLIEDNTSTGDDVKLPNHNTELEWEKRALINLTIVVSYSVSM